MGLKQAVRYLIPYRKPIARYPRVMALREDDVRFGTVDELNLIRLGYARTPKEARRLMRKHHATHAQDVIDRMPVRKGATVWTRLQSVGMKITGESTYNPLKDKGDKRMPYRVKYK